jgi:hypothetical protein
MASLAGGLDGTGRSAGHLPPVSGATAALAGGGPSNPAPSHGDEAGETMAPAHSSNPGTSATPGHRQALGNPVAVQLRRGPEG